MPNLTDEQTARLRDLLDRVDLSGIQFHEMTAKLALDLTSHEESQEAKIDLDYQLRATDQDFGVRAVVELNADSGSVRVVVAADYDLNKPGKPDDPTLDLFATEVAMMTLFPYLREGVQTLTGRVFGSPVLLPILNRGDLTRKEE